jgi:hypothetical protein
VHVDRTACPWLIRRFVDPQAEFVFVPAEKIQETVDEEHAIPYDAQGVELGHHGDECSFDAIVKKYGIEDAAVPDLADIVRAADTGKPERSPQAAGLDAIMTGISIAAKDDHEAVAKAALVYDAFYTFCRLRLFREEHKTELDNMDRTQRRDFIRAKLKEQGMPWSSSF